MFKVVSSMSYLMSLLCAYLRSPTSLFMYFAHHMILHEKFVSLQISIAECKGLKFLIEDDCHVATNETSNIVFKEVSNRP